MQKLLCWFLLALTLRADVTLAPLFTDHAVLQRDKALPIWGWASPGEHVTVTFGEQKVGAITDAKGKWLVVLSPLPGSSTPAELKISGKNALTLTDVVVGDVWLCSGQSNMEFTVSRAENAEAEITSAHNPLIRCLTVAKAPENKPAEKFQGSWLSASPATVGNFTAVGYFFARDLQPRIGVPMGLINSSVGGTEIELWIGQKAFDEEPAAKATLANWTKLHADYDPAEARFHQQLDLWTNQEKQAHAKHQHWLAPKPIEPVLYGPQGRPASLFNGMINPLIPAAIRGFLWYQGEANWYRPHEYHTYLELLIRSWRNYFGQGELPFLLVQLPNFKNGNGAATDWAVLRDEQAHALTLPNTGMAVTIDLGNPNDVHPKNKQEVGRRLALIARSQVYGMVVDDSGPIFDSAEREGTAFRVHFTHAGTGLTAEDHPLLCFQIAGFDRKFFPANARIEGDSVLVSSKDVLSPVAVRYAWFNDPSANLYNGAGMPARPFRTDDW